MTTFKKENHTMHELLIQNIQQKIKLSREETESLKQYFIPKKIRKRQYLLNAGDKCNYLTFVENGLLRLFSVDDNGHEHVMQFALEGWWISDMASFLCGDDAMAYFSPAIEMHQGVSTGRTGKYRYGSSSPVFNENGKSVLSVEDLAVAIVDEIEKPQFHRQQFTAAY